MGSQSAAQLEAGKRAAVIKDRGEVAACDFFDWLAGCLSLRARDARESSSRPTKSTFYHHYPS
jgi:hypothetical protein